MRDKVIKRVLSDRLIVIVRGMKEDEILPLAEALAAGGISMIEVTFNQSDPDSFPRTMRAIKAISARFGGDVYAGAGTVLTLGQLDMARDAGALYVISPNADAGIISATVSAGLVSIPGCLTPTECVAAHSAGADFIKLFPTGVMGAGYVRALVQPLSHMRFLGVGGITDGNIPELLAAGAVGFGVGGGLVRGDLVKSGQADKITALAKRYVAAARG